LKEMMMKTTNTKVKALNTTPRAQRAGAAVRRVGVATGSGAAVAGKAVGSFFANFWRGLKHG
jgi:hypothetical protein